MLMLICYKCAAASRAAPAAAAVPAAVTHAESAPPPAAAPAAAVNHPSDESLLDRVAALEATVADLAARLATLEEIL